MMKIKDLSIEYDMNTQTKQIHYLASQTSKFRKRVYSQEILRDLRLFAKVVRSNYISCRYMRSI